MAGLGHAGLTVDAGAGATQGELVEGAEKAELGAGVDLGAGNNRPAGVGHGRGT